MKYRFVLALCLLSLLCLLAVSPASADLKKIGKGGTVYIGETGLDISSALDGARQIAWWPAGNSTDTAPAVILNLTETEAFSYTISPTVFTTRTGTWYRYYPKPRNPVFVVAKPAFNLTVWDLDHNRDITGQSVARSTNITYRIDTNLYTVYDKVQRPDYTLLDSFVKVSLKSPSGQSINNIYTGSIMLADTQIYPVDTAPIVRSSPFYWKYGGQWNRSARGADGTPVYPLGTYTFTATQNLNGMQSSYGESDSRVATGPRTVTFVEDVPVVTTMTTRPAATGTKTTVTTTEAGAEITAEETPLPTETVKATWTSTPLPPQVALLALALVSAVFLYRIRRSS